MIPILVLTHGTLADELLQAAQTIDPHVAERSFSLPLPWDVTSDEAGRTVKAKIRELDQGEGVLILTDMFGGTATNVALPHLLPDRVEVVTGVNLPMLVKLGSLRQRGMSVKELAENVTKAGQKSIRLASEFLRTPAPS